MSRKKRKQKELEELQEEKQQEKEYQWLVTLQIKLDYKDNQISPIDYIRIFDRKPDAMEFVESEIERHKEYYAGIETDRKHPIEMKSLKKLTCANVVKWWRKDTGIIWTWTYEVFKVEYAKSMDNDNNNKNKQ